MMTRRFLTPDSRLDRTGFVLDDLGRREFLLRWISLHRSALAVTTGTLYRLFTTLLV